LAANSEELGDDLFLWYERIFATVVLWIQGFSLA